MKGFEIEDRGVMARCCAFLKFRFLCIELLAIHHASCGGLALFSAGAGGSSGT
jgi:hypothetical protein